MRIALFQHQFISAIPKGLHVSAQGWHEVPTLGCFNKINNPERVELFEIILLILTNGLCGIYSTLSGLKNNVALTQGSALRNPGLIRCNPFRIVFL